MSLSGGDYKFIDNKVKTTFLASLVSVIVILGLVSFEASKKYEERLIKEREERIRLIKARRKAMKQPKMSQMSQN